MLDQITYLILAGGRGQRMNGQDKGLMTWQDKPMIEHLMSGLDATPGQVIISANRNLETYQQYADTVVKDTLDDYQGPLAGILSAMQQCQTDYLLCIPCDTPAPPSDLQSQLSDCMLAAQKTDALCHDGERLQPLFALLHCRHKILLEDFLQQGRRKVQEFMKLIDPAICDFSSQPDAFNNFNRPEDMQYVAS